MSGPATIQRRSIWTCTCGRKVPTSVDQCRCGNARPAEPPAPEPTASLGGAADFFENKAVEQAASPEAKSDGGLFGPKSMAQIAGVVLLVGLYFGSRYFNKWRVSRSTRAELVSALTSSLGADGAEKAADLYHEQCFEQTYAIGWGRRGAGSKFDAEKYVQCVAKLARR